LTYGLSAFLHVAITRPDVVLVLNVANGYWLPILRLLRIPVTVNVDGIEWERAKWGRLAKAVFYIGARMTAVFADRIICDSIEIRSRWMREFGRRGVFIPYGGSSSDSLEPVEGFESRSYALMVARLVPENTVEEFIDAAQVLASDIDVVVVGSSGYGGDLEARVAELARNCQRVRWLGHVNNDEMLFSLWQYSGVYFHGHSVGGTNPALVQAMACGAPVVARDTVYNREVLGDAGIFVSPSGRAIVEAIESVMSDDELRERLSSSARMRALSHYSWDQVCAQYESELLDTLQREK
jgi:glycosyltransferase involved in cell wall biosynthesis